MAELGWLYRARRSRAEPRNRARVGVVPYLIVYVGPLTCCAMMSCSATLLHGEHTRGAGPSVKALMMAVIAPAIEGTRDLGGFIWVVAHLALIAAFAVKPHPLSACLSLLAVAAWLMWGVWIVGVGW